MSDTTGTRARIGATRVRVLLLLALAGCLVLSGCGFTVYSLPLPGGADLGSHPITIKAEFANVLDLVPKSSVKVDDVGVGEITDVSLTKDDHAMVTMKIRDDTKLPDNTIATIRQTSLLGEKFVSLAPPATGAQGNLSSGDLIPLARTGDNPQIESVLEALSLVLNGGGVAQLKTIAGELNNTFSGREDQARDVLTQIKDLTGQLDDHKGDIVAAITSLNHLSVSVKGQLNSIDGALEQLPSALTSINQQRAALVRVLKALDQLGTVGVRVIKETKSQTIRAVTLLQPVLTQLANSGSALVKSLSVGLTYPFVDQAVGRDPQVARNLKPGDYTNLSAEVDLDLSTLQQTGVCTPLAAIPSGLPINKILNLPDLCKGATAALDKCLSQRTVAACAGLPAGVLGSVCASLPVPIPGLCSVATITTKQGNGKGKGKGLLGGVLGGLPAVPGVTSGTGGNAGGVLGGLLNGGGLNRAPSDLRTGQAPTTQRAAMFELAQRYDPALVSLLTPGMVLR